MQIVLNEKNEIMSFSSTGEIDDSRAREYDGALPDDFMEEFNPGAYLLDGNNAIVKNPDYVAPKIVAPTGPTDQDKVMANLILKTAKNKADQDKFNSQLLLEMAKLGGNK